MAFHDILYSWFDEHGRTLPWRGIDDPYRIWLSEIILQQTRIEQGRDYYHRFVEAFPTVQDLAAASEEQVLRLWQGLGYYSRARNLHAAARQVVDQWGGHFPNNSTDLQQLKGVGRYTAAAIASFAFREAVPVVDGNVYRAVSRLRAVSTPINTPQAYDEFASLLSHLIDPQRPDRFNAALMDFGSLQCTPRPNCQICPFAAQCVALQTGRVELLPVRMPKSKPSNRYFYYLDLVCGNSSLHRPHPTGRVLLQRRARDIWRGLWELPLVESDRPLAPDEVQQSAIQLAHEQYGIVDLEPKPVCTLKHQLTHRTIHATFLRAEIAEIPSAMPPNARFVSPSEQENLPVSRLIDKYLHVD